MTPADGLDEAEVVRTAAQAAEDVVFSRYDRTAVDAALAARAAVDELLG